MRMQIESEMQTETQRAHERFDQSELVQLIRFYYDHRHLTTNAVCFQFFFIVSY